MQLLYDATKQSIKPGEKASCPALLNCFLRKEKIEAPVTTQTAARQNVKGKLMAKVSNKPLGRLVPKTPPKNEASRNIPKVNVTKTVTKDSTTFKTTYEDTKPEAASNVHLAVNERVAKGLVISSHEQKPQSSGIHKHQRKVIPEGEIIKMAKTGLTTRQLAKNFGISAMTISRVLKGQRFLI